MLDSGNENAARTRLPRWRRLLRTSVVVLAAVLASGGVWVSWRRGTGNTGTIEPGRIYRSAQLGASALECMIRERGIKTVLNLRGANPEESWYQQELAATLRAGATQVDVPLASDQWLSREQVETLLAVLDNSAYPILIHCEFGAERTGLVAALATLLRPESDLGDARAQFHLGHLFLPIGDGRVMVGHLEAYESWLRDNRVEHTPEQLRHWLASAYRPGHPSREFWPCNPYPRRVVTRRVGGQRCTEVDRSPRACPRMVASGEPETRE
jgi:protein tyrosine phosphatase (PTP) superfamily phosphohydrolase (DUF442 family)